MSIPYSAENGIIRLYYHLQMHVPEVQQLSPHRLKQHIGNLITDIGSHPIANDLMELQASIDGDRGRANSLNVYGVALDLEKIIKKYGLSID